MPQFAFTQPPVENYRIPRQPVGRHKTDQARHSGRLSRTTAMSPKSLQGRNVVPLAVIVIRVNAPVNVDTVVYCRLRWLEKSDNVSYQVPIGGMLEFFDWKFGCWKMHSMIQKMGVVAVFSMSLQL